MKVILDAMGGDNAPKEILLGAAAAVKELGVEIKYTLHPGVHDWNFWDSYIKEVLDWLPLANDMV